MISQRAATHLKWLIKEYAASMVIASWAGGGDPALIQAKLDAPRERKAQLYALINALTEKKP